MSDMLMYLLKKYEKKLKELMGEEAYTEWAVVIAKEALLTDIEGMEDGEFKDFALEHFDEITRGPGE